MLSLATELTLIALDERGHLGGNEATETALAGAWIVELLELGRIELVAEVAEPMDDQARQLAAGIGLGSGRGGLLDSLQRRMARHEWAKASMLGDDWVTVVDTRPTGMPDVDLALTWLATPDRKTLVTWIAVLGHYSVSSRVMGALESASVVVRASGRQRYPFAPIRWEVVDPKPEHDVRDRLARAVVDVGSVGARDTCLLRLVETCGLEYALWRSEYPEIRRQVDQMRGCRVDAAVRRVVDRRVGAA